jgi:hypothetical protein
MGLARAKNTERAAARRRTRAARTAALAASEDATPREDEATAAEPEAARPRAALRIPDVRADLRALPGMFRTRRLLWVPVLMLLVAFALAVAADQGALPADLVTPAAYYVQLTLPPTALFPFFIGGFLAPRASYLVGFLLGLLDGVLIILWLTQRPAQATPGTPLPSATAADYLTLMFTAVLVGTFAAAFAAWYRGFLRQSQERARANRMARDEKQRAERKEAEREARRSASGRTTSP